MPYGNYGTTKIAGKTYQIRFWSSLKSDCQREVKRLHKAGFLARVIKHPIQMGTLAGGAVFEQWAVAQTAPHMHRPAIAKVSKIGKSVTRETRGKRHGRK